MTTAAEHPTEIIGGTIDLGDVAFATRLPRLAPAGLSRDGLRLLLTRQLPDPVGPDTTCSLWEIDTTGRRPARQLPSSRRLDGATYCGDAIVGIADCDETADGDRGTGMGRQLCRLLADGALQPLTDLPGGCELAAAGPAPVAVVLARPGTRAATVRARLGVVAEWHESFPARRLGQPHHGAPARLLVVRADAEPLDVTPAVGSEAFGHRAAAAPAVLSPDGNDLALAWAVPDGWFNRTVTLLIDTRTGACRTAFDLPGRDVSPSGFSADGAVLVCTSTDSLDLDTPTGPKIHTLDLRTGAARELFGGVAPYVWDAVPTADGRHVIAMSDVEGRAALDLVDPVDGTTRRLLTADGHLGSLEPTPDGTAIIAWADRVDRPPRPVRISISDGAVTELDAPGIRVTCPGLLAGQWADLPGGRGRVHGILALPEPGDAAATVPLLVFLHGGPGGAWGSWTSGWSPWPAVARGYAVLLANIAPSTGYGEAAMSRAWTLKGRESLADLEALLDRLHADHPRIDPDRVGLLGCSHGGFLVNWMAGATDRFRAAVSMAGIWDLPSMDGTSDLEHPLAAPRDLATGSPRLQVENIGTPMLIVHGEQDHRVPLTQALWQWRDLLAAHARRDDGQPQPHRLLIFPDEHHVITRPHNLTCWWQAVLAFTDTHVRGLSWDWPSSLDPRPVPGGLATARETTAGTAAEPKAEADAPVHPQGAQ